jgi:hypothetical protein
VPSRRAVLATLGAAALAGCERLRPNAATTPTPPPADWRRLTAVSAETVSPGATVGLSPEAGAEFRRAAAAADETHAPVHGDHWTVLARGPCLAFEGKRYRVEAHRHEDAKTVYILDRAERGAGECATLRVLGTAVEGVTDGDRAGEGETVPVPGETVRALREAGYDYVVVGGTCYAVPAAGA